MREEASTGEGSSPRNEANRSLQRAVSIIEVLAQAAEQGQEFVPLTSLAKRSGLAKSTVHRLLQGLDDAMFVSSDGGGGYRLGTGLVRIGDLARRSNRQLDPVADALRRLAAMTGDTAFYTERVGTIGVCVWREDGTGPFRNNVLAVGDRHPLGVGAGSLAILAALPPETAGTIQQENLRTFGPDAVDGRVLRSDPFTEALTSAREQGWALNAGTFVEESWAIGMAIPAADSGVHSALSVASIRSRLQEPRRTMIVEALHRECAALADSGALA